MVKTNRKNSLAWLLFFVFSLQVAKAQNAALNEKLPMDPSVKTGKLSNGLQYFIKKNKEPEKRAELRLVMKAGSILETEEQRGLAHFMEHMNFNGTKNFPKNELVNFLEKEGIKFGADLNAYTSFDETVYMLPVPTDDKAKFEKFMSVLADWSGNATLDHSEIDKERGVIIEEARLRKGAQQRITEKLFPVIFQGSRFANRLPIGLDEVILKAPYSEFEKFKKDWYRPNLQAVVAVGDFEVEDVEKMIHKLFSDFKNPSPEKERKEYSVDLKGNTDAIVITDKEQPYSMIQLFYLQPERKDLTVNDRRNNFISSLFNQMIGNRIAEISRKADPPFLGASTSYSSFLGGLDYISSVSIAKGTEIEKALIAIVDENKRVEKFGFTQGELDRAKLNYKASIEKSLNEKSKTNSGVYVNGLVAAFLADEVMTDIEFDKKLVDQYLDGIKLEEINDFVKKTISTNSRVVSLVAPEKDKDSLPSEARLKELLDNTGSTITAYQDVAVASSLIEKMPVAGKIKSEKKVNEINATEIVFENGVKVLLKPTDFKNDEIVFSGSRWGGTRLFGKDTYDNAALASQIAGQSGNGKLTSTELTKYLSGKVASGAAGIGSTSESVRGNSSVKDFETSLQIIYNKFTNNNIDKEAVSSFLNSNLNFFKSIEATPTPEKVFGDTLNAVLGNYHYSAMPMTAERFAKIDADKSFDIFKERFADAADFHFVFVGNFEVEKIKPLLAKYLGSLPSSNKTFKYQSAGIYPPKGKVERTVKKGTEDKATVHLAMTGKYEPTEKNKLNLDSIGEIIQLKITEKLREEEGGAYSPRAFLSVGDLADPTYSLTIRFGSSAENVDKLVRIALDEVKKINENGGSQEDLDKYIANEKLNYQTSLRNNSFWLNSLLNRYSRGRDLKEVLDYEKKLGTITTASVKEVAGKYLKGENLIKVVLLPEDK